MQPKESIIYIHSSLSSEIRLYDLAAVAHMNDSYFSSFFKKYMGISPLEYVIKKRLNRKTTLVTACVCGFNSTSSFNKTFRKFIGKVPSDFR